MSQEGKEEDGIVYDKAGDTASLVLRRPDRDKTTVLDTIDGAALRTIGARSLKGAIETLALPAHVRAVEDGNAPRPCRKLVLNEGLETIGDRCFSELAAESPVRIPRSVRTIGKGSFSGTMLGFDALDAIVAIPGGPHALFKPCRYLENEKSELVCAGPCNNGKEAEGPKRPASTESETPWAQRVHRPLRHERLQHYAAFGPIREEQEQGAALSLRKRHRASRGVCT